MIKTVSFLVFFALKRTILLCNSFYLEMITFFRINLEINVVFHYLK